MKLLSDCLVHTSVPDKYVLPPEKRPSLLNDEPSSDVAIPVIDLHGADDSRRHLVAAEIIKASKEFGIFQARGEPRRGRAAEDVVQGFREAAAGFFAMPAEDKLPYRSDDLSKRFRVSSSTPYDRNGDRYWLDYLKINCHPVTDKHVREWPDKPGSFRSALAEYSTAVHELAQTLLRLIAEGLGLDGGFFAGDLSGGSTQMNVNYYPPCPDPSLTLGLLPHCDRHLLTVLSQGDVAGLQARHRHGGRWLLICPVPGAFVVNLGHQMEIITNGLLASVEHRAVTNTEAVRLSVVTLIMPKMECRVGPAPEMVNEATGPVKFKEFEFSEFIKAYSAAAASREDVLHYFRIHR